MDPRVARALAEIHERLATAEPVATFARGVDLSTSRFAQLFRAAVGTSPARYIHALRMIRAQLLIDRTSLSIKEVMAHVGCSDPSHFTRDFRAFHGLSPREWRRETSRRGLRDANSDTVDSASVARVAVLANERQKGPTKPTPRARAPDGTLQQTVVNIGTTPSMPQPGGLARLLNQLLALP